jgi:SPP1 gp7 family putative phage head morphogenesis protein
VFLEALWEERGGKLVPHRILHAHPGQFVFDAESGEFLFYQTRRVPSPGQIFHANLPGAYENPLGESPVWGLRYLYEAKRKLLSEQVKAAAKFGTPIVHGKVPNELTEKSQSMNDFLVALQELPDGAVIVTANGEEIEVHPRNIGAGATDIFDNPISRIDSYIRTALLGSELATVAGQNGSRAASQTHEAVMLRTLAPYSAPIRKAVQALIDLVVKVNFGDTAPIPQLTIDFEIPSDAQETRATLETAFKIGLPISESEAREKLGLRPPSVAEQSEFADSDIDKAWEQYHATVNMTADDLQRWSETACSRRASLNRAPIERNLALLRKPKSEWGVRDAKQALRTVSFVARMRGAMGDLANVVSEECPFTKAEIALANWAWASPRIQRAVFSRRVRSVRQVALDSVTKADDIKERAVKEMVIDARPSVRELFNRTAERVKQDGFDFNAIDARFLRTDILCERLVATATLAAALDTAKIKQALLVDRPGLFRVSDLGEAFADAVRWMISRKVMTTDDIFLAAQQLSSQFGGDARAAENFIRQTAFAVSQIADLGLVEHVQNLLARAARDGLSVDAFVQNLPDSVGGALSYWEMVFRTEIGLQYTEQQRMIESDPDLKDFLWGYEYTNPADERSRPGHAELNGKQVQLGSAELAAIGRPPFSYQCRCAMVPLIEVEPGEFKTAAGTIDLAEGIERF